MPSNIPRQPKVSAFKEVFSEPTNGGRDNPSKPDVATGSADPVNQNNGHITTSSSNRFEDSGNFDAEDCEQHSNQESSERPWDAVSVWNRSHSGERPILGRLQPRPRRSPIHWFDCGRNFTAINENKPVDPAITSDTEQLNTNHQLQTDGAFSSGITEPTTDSPRSSVSGDQDETDLSGTYCKFNDTFISSRGNEYFCEIDEDYLTDRFNLTGLNTDVQYYQYALDLVTDVFDLDCDDDMREQIEKSARHLYGLVHARYITTTRGLAKMLEKYKKNDFGRCPRVDCKSHPLLPTGMADLPHVQSVKLYCAKCEDLYNPKSSRHSTIDGAYFGTSFQNILFQVYPALIPEKSVRRYQPRIFGFKVHAAAALERWQDARREEMQERLREVGLENVFVEDAEAGEGQMEEDDDEEEEEGEGLGAEGMDVGDDAAE